MATGMAGSRRRAGGEWSGTARWNFLTLGSDIAFFSLGLAISSAYTVLPLFVHHLTPDNTIVALIPAIRALGVYGPQLFAAGLVERRRHALPFILSWTVFERVPYLLLIPLTLLLAGEHGGALTGIFLAVLFVTLFAGGICYPAWLDLIARALPSGWMGRFMGIWSGVGALMGIAGAALAAALIAGVPWPGNFAWCFGLTFAAFVVSFVLLALGREPERDRISATPSQGVARPGVRAQAREISALVRADGGLRRFLGANALAGMATMSSTLFAVAALRLGGLSEAEVGALSTVLLVAQTVGNVLWGWVGDRFGSRWVLVCAGVAAAAAALVALAAHGIAAYAVVFLLLGLSLSATALAGFTFIAHFGPEARRPTYIAVSSVAYAPFAVGAPLLGGWMADTWGYIPVFVTTAVAGLLAAGAFARLVPDRGNTAGHDDHDAAPAAIVPAPDAAH